MTARFIGALPALASFLSVLTLLGIAGFCTADLYNEDVSEGIPAFSYVAVPMKLDVGQYVHLDLEVSGSASFFFVDANSFSRFQDSSSFTYLVPLSEQSTNAIDKTAQVPYAGTWYVVVSNTDGFNSLSLTGHISAYMDPLLEPVADSSGLSIPRIALVVVLLAAAVIIIIAVVLYATKRPKDEADGGPQTQQPDFAFRGQPGVALQVQPGYCDQCGSPLKMHSRFCPGCGRTL